MFLSESKDGHTSLTPMRTELTTDCSFLKTCLFQPYFYVLKSFLGMRNSPERFYKSCFRNRFADCLSSRMMSYTLFGMLFSLSCHGGSCHVIDVIFCEVTTISGSGSSDVVMIKTKLIASDVFASESQIVS